MVSLSTYGNFYSEQYLNTKFKKFIKKFGFSDELHIHSLRHTTASLLINSVVLPKLVAEQLGHAIASITQDIYSHIFQSSKARAAQALKIALVDKKRAKGIKANMETMRRPGDGLEFVAYLLLKSTISRLFLRDGTLTKIAENLILSAFIRLY